jgi:predicted Zn finger-like uncharacterized protein
MLLTCPECSAKYNVADGAIPATGRTVRCAACQHSWVQMPAIAVPMASDLPERPIKQNVLNGLRARPKASTPPPALEPHARMRKRAYDKIALRNRIIAGAPWALAAGMAIGGVIGAVSYRTDIVRAWPKSASAFAAIGQPANLYGIDIRGIQARAGLDTKGPRVVVAGVLASVSRKPEPVAYLKVSLVDAKGMEKLSWMVDPGITVLDPGKTHIFETARSNPVRGELRAIVTFAEPPPRTPRPPPEPPTGKTGLMGANSLEPAPKVGASSSSPEPITAR